MAQVLSYFSAEASGGATMYRYARADDTSSATRIYSGTPLTLPADYSARITNSMCPLLSPSGWMFWYNVSGITPVYETVTDPCTPPEGLSIENGMLIITGGAGGDLNALTGFGVSWRERKINTSAWGAWSADEIVTGRAVDTAVGSGMVRQYRVRTMGEAGEAYYSEYAVCAQLLNGNAAAGTPVVLLPVSGMETASAAVAVRIDCPAEPDGDDMTLQRSLDGGEWTDVLSMGGAGGTVTDIVAADRGAHSVKYRLKDANGVCGGEDGVAFTCVDMPWKREIRQGDVIANREISFVSDIMELLARVNTVRAFYGLPSAVLPGSVGRISDWQRQLTALQQAVGACRTAAGLPAAEMTAASAWPCAQQINQLRWVIDNT